MLVNSEVRTVQDACNNTFADMSFTDRVGSIEVLFYLTENIFTRIDFLKCSDAMQLYCIRNNESFKFHNGMYAHLLTTFLNLSRRIFYYITIFVDHGHTIDIYFTARMPRTSFMFRFFIRRSLFTVIRESSSRAILLGKFRILYLAVGNLRHNRRAIRPLESDNLIVYYFALAKFVFKLRGHCHAEIIRIIEAARALSIQDYTTSSGDISIFLVILTMAMEQFVKPRLLGMNQRQIPCTTRSAMHFQSKLNCIARLKRIQIIR